MQIPQAISDHQAKQPVCGNCARWLRSTEPRMPDHGECKLRSVGHYTYRGSDCRIAPSRFEPLREVQR